MPEPRFEETGEGAFFGAFVCDKVVPRHHFLRRLRELIPWERFTQMLLEYYQGDGRQGRPPYNPALILWMLLIAYLYNLSERQTEQMVNENIPMKYFVGLAVDESAPDHSTLTAFKARLRACGREEAFERMLAPCRRGSTLGATPWLATGPMKPRRPGPWLSLRHPYRPQSRRFAP